MGPVSQGPGLERNCGTRSGTKEELWGRSVAVGAL